MQPMDSEAYLKALLSAPRPGAGAYLAFYDHRVGGICTDPRLLLLPLDDHICHRGDGLFESICYRERTIFALDRHMARMRDGAAALNITPPCPFDEIRARVIDVARTAGQDHGALRVFLSRGPGGFGISPAECPVAGLYIVALADTLPDEALYERGVTAFTSRIPPKQEYLARIKNTNYLPNVFMAAEAAERGMDVAVTFDENGCLGEAAIANIAIIDDGGRFRSPEIVRILPGTTLLAALEIAAGRMPVVQGPVTHADVESAREILLFTSSKLCLGVTHFDGRPVGTGDSAGHPGPVARWLRDRLLARMLETGARF